ncbi:PAS/PAC sensor signal transduction histidine kinase [Halobacillus karajensis]|uniref:histidine kinase n=1 Tax=Halobacillus karajensis TaxID=195088 RepID=A0A024P1J3_9BACI|nr:ATP-binding protein [Halobacillus karajensis]CDQ19456.1 Sensor protein SrrB [Halobacillus karajensis]CDQ21918.1 Sensor protein SrrB [Halobacillus karajensis]CDQ27759.1 Sensor protein SrrB [Halobacillus karajensis]SEH82168.1 PAS/PAC sensor signal transduction histidine kinase [Halobacillus karajensis]
MFWRSVVVKLWFTILFLVCFVLFILTVLLLEFFQNYHILEAERHLLQTADKISDVVDRYEDDEELMLSTTALVKDSASRAVIVRGSEDLLVPENDSSSLPELSYSWFERDEELSAVLEEGADVKKVANLTSGENGIMVVGTPLNHNSGAVFVYQSLDTIEETSEQTTKIIFLGAGIAIVLTTIFAFFLSTRITAPLIKMREGALELAKGEFNTKIPIRTHDEIGELAMAFNRMGRELKFHINALNQEKEQLSGILSSMADGVITFNRQGDVLISNPPAQHYLEAYEFERYSVSSQSGRPALPEPLEELFNSVIHDEKESMVEMTLQGRSWVIIMTPLYDREQVRGAVAVLRDMTEERRLNKLRKDFIANVSHELRTPISMLQGYSEAIVDDIAESKEDKNELAQIIHDESLRIGRLVNELLDLARMEAGHIQLSTEPVEIQSFMNKIIRKFSGIANEKEVDLELRIDSGFDLLHFDPDRIEQVFTNLIDNAIRHSNQGSAVKVIIEKGQKEWVASVKDSGFGIKEEDLPFVFERFYKADKSRKRENKNYKKGTGLGLAIAKNIVEAHEGSISVHSKLQEGTTFTFKIPFASTEK